eukprot:scaffold55292_cov60-Phaeocystis_antarctica.AAC.3
MRGPSGRALMEKGSGGRRHLFVRRLRLRCGGGGVGLVAEARDVEGVGEEDRVTAAQRLEVPPLQLRVDHRRQLTLGIAREAALAPCAVGRLERGVVRVQVVEGVADELERLLVERTDHAAPGSGAHLEGHPVLRHRWQQWVVARAAVPQDEPDARVLGLQVGGERVGERVARRAHDRDARVGRRLGVELARPLRLEGLAALVGEVGEAEAAVQVLVAVAHVALDRRRVVEQHRARERVTLRERRVADQVLGQLHAVALVAVRAARDRHATDPADLGARPLVRLHRHRRP